MINNQTGRELKNMIDTKLKPLLREPEFWVLLLVSLPGLVTGISESVRAAWDAVQGQPITYDTQAWIAALTGSPIVVYLGLGRPNARKGAAIGAGHVLAATATWGDVETNPPAGVDDASLSEPIPGDVEVAV